MDKPKAVATRGKELGGKGGNEEKGTGGNEGVYNRRKNDEGEMEHLPGQKVVW